MSEIDPPNQTPDKKPSDGSAARESRARKWRKRLTRITIFLVVLAFVMRAVVQVVFPPVLRKVAKAYGLNATYDRLELYLVGGDVGLWGLRFTPIAGGEPVLATAYCRASISELGLFRGRLDVNRVEAEDTDLVIERTADGRIPLIEQFIGEPSAPASQTPQTTKAQPLSFDSPLTIDVARLQSATAHFRDLSISPHADVSLNLDALITNAGSPSKRAKFEIAIHSPQALAAMYVTGSGQSHDNILDAELSLRMYGLNLMPATAYLAPFGVVPISGDLTAHADGKFQARLTGGPGSTTQPSAPLNLSATLDLTGLTLLTESREAAGVDHVLIDASSLSPDLIQIRQILIDGVRATASRSTQGRVRFAGIELVGAASSPPPPQPRTAPRHWPVIDLKQLLVQNTNFSFADSSMDRPVALGLQVQQLSMMNLCTDPAQNNSPATLSLSATAPGIAKTITVEGTATPDKSGRSLAMSVNVSGINPEAADPYLEAARLSRKFNDGKFTCKVNGRIEPKSDGSLTGSLKISDSALADGNRQLLSMPLIEFQNATIDSAASSLRVDAISFTGPILAAHTESNGAIDVLGLQYDPATTIPIPKSQPTITPTTKPAAGHPISLPSIAIGKFTWRGANLRLDSTSSNLSVEDVRFDGNNLIFDPTGQNTTPGSVRMSLKSPGVVEDFSIDGKLAAGAGSIAFDLQGQSTGISAQKLRSLLNAINIDPDLKAGTLGFTARGKVTQTDGRLSADLNLGNTSFTDGDINWLSMDNLAVANASFDGTTLQVDSIQIDKPAAQVMRDENGVIALAGMKLLPPKAGPSALTTIPTTQPQTKLDLSLPIIAKIKSFEMHDAAVHLIDADVLPRADLTTNVSVWALDLLAGADGAPSKFTLALSSPGAIDSLTVHGDMKLAPARQEISLTAMGNGLSCKTLEPYFPPNIRSHIKDGQFTAKLSASLEPNPQGGSRAQLSVTDVALREKMSGPPVASIGALRIGVDQLDLAQQRVAISEIALEHATLAVRQDDAGLALLGLTISPTPVRPIKTAPPVPKPVVAAGASNVAALVAQANERGPLITVDKLALGADQISFTAPALARPLTLTNLSLTNAAKIELLGDEPTQRPPVSLQFRATLQDLVDSIALDGRFAPYSTDPSANLVCNITGIHGNAITSLVPELKDTLDGPDLTDGRFTASVDTHVAFTRRGPIGIDLSRDITSTFEVKNIELSQSNKPLAGLEDIRGEGIRFSPATGSLTVKSLDITKPSATVVRDTQGIHALGLTLHPPPTTRPAIASTAPVEKRQSPVAIAQTQPAPSPTNASAEYRIDRLTVSGADFVIEDRVGTPTTLLPIKDLDVEVKGLSSLALTEPNKPIRFSALVGAGKVPLPPKQPKPGVETEDRDLFAEATVAGNLTLVPKPQGFVKASLSGLELT